MVDGNGHLRLFRPVIPAAYDYYPFGMLIRERTAIDTASHPSYESRLLSVPVLDTGIVVMSSVNTGVAYGATLSYGGGGVVTMSGTNGELGIVVPGLVPGLPATVKVKVKVSYMKDVVGLSVRDSTDAVQLGSTAVTHNDWWGVIFTPMQGTVVVKVGIFPYLPKSATLLRVDSVVWEQQVGVDYRTQLVRIGTKVVDRYEFGYNGQMKVSEVAGLGNHNTALFWEYDTRLGRRWNLDPKPIIGISQYACIQNSPIKLSDPFSDVVRFEREEGVSKREFRTMKRQPRQLRKHSETFATMYNELDKSDKIFTYRVTNSDGGDAKEDYVIKILGFISRSMYRKKGLKVKDMLNLAVLLMRLGTNSGRFIILTLSYLKCLNHCLIIQPALTSLYSIPLTFYTKLHIEQQSLGLYTLKIL